MFTSLFLYGAAVVNLLYIQRKRFEIYKAIQLTIADSFTYLDRLCLYLVMHWTALVRSERCSQVRFNKMIVLSLNSFYHADYISAYMLRLVWQEK